MNVAGTGDDTNLAFWQQAARRGVRWFRFLRRPMSIADLDRHFEGTYSQEEWQALKAKMEPGDDVWPFCFHVRKYLGMRSGYVVLRGGEPIGGIVTIVS